jgi:hypothetical protein
MLLTYNAINSYLAVTKLQFELQRYNALDNYSHLAAQQSGMVYACILAMSNVDKTRLMHNKVIFETS